MVDMIWEEPVANELWRSLNLGDIYEWEVKANKQIHLRDLVKLLPIEVFIGEAGTVNRRLRAYLSSHLRGRDAALRSNLASWIISSWGGIRTNDKKTIDQYINSLGNFSPNDVETFVRTKGTKGISSWSKLLAFANCQKYAVYDSRTAVAINCALSNLGMDIAFAMPPGRGRHIKEASLKLRRQRMQKGIRGNWIQYTHYISLLESFVALESPTAPKDILAAEMVIFANAPKVAQHFNWQNK